MPQAGNEAEVLIFDQRVGDDEAGDDEEDIDADEAARHAAEMVHDHHQNGECPDVFDSGAETGPARSAGLGSSLESTESQARRWYQIGRARSKNRV